MSAASKLCKFKGCDRPATWIDLCHGHGRQHARGQKLTALRRYGADLVSLNIRIPRPVANRLRKAARVAKVSTYELVGAMIEEASNGGGSVAT